ncbi:hypothetical protein PGTUg99_030108 [Puccinia graminis f. sp. tritici]|uniref:Uncharacterized protein n=1 Tax=Puccinia graminis f. sp. tritici TaxID=56615 RepID=A0A5B0R7M9_PUCGR|nr:hypothetical protein PGTUg99_030108 [Puccinia graminis f. sp. tritici]
MSRTKDEPKRASKTEDCCRSKNKDGLMKNIDHYPRLTHSRQRCASIQSVIQCQRWVFRLCVLIRKEFNGIGYWTQLITLINLNRSRRVVVAHDQLIGSIGSPGAQWI